jgi:hypothetical protein
MRKVLVSMAAIGVALAAVPAMAQYNPGGGYGGGYGNGNGGYNNGYGRPGNVTPWQVRDMVERAINRGELSRHDARELREDVRDLMRRAARARYDNGDWGARRDIDRRTADILRDLQRARRDGGRNGNGYGNGYGDRDGGWRGDNRNGY